MGDTDTDTDTGRAAAGRARSAPFAHLAPAATLAVGYGVAALGWALAGDVLPGGRWLAVHLFTLGVLSNLVLAMTEHFSATLTRVARDGRAWPRLALFNAGAVGVLFGLPTGWRVLLVAGAVVATAAVLWHYVNLRRMRTRSLGARFEFVVRAYERATAAFLHGAVLGALLGVGVLSGEWYGAVRLAHLTINVLGWGGLVLLATVVFFGPTLLRARMAPNAQRLAVPALRHGATALTVGVVGLVVTGAEGIIGQGGHAVAVAGLAGYAVAVAAVCLPVLRSARNRVPSAHGSMIVAACVWLPVVAWAGVVIFALDHRPLLDTLGLVLLIGVLAQAILASISYLAPMVFGRTPAARAVARHRLDRLALLRPATFNAGLTLLAGGHLVGVLTAVDVGLVTAVGWGLLAAAVAGTLVVGGAAARAARTGAAG